MAIKTKQTQQSVLATNTLVIRFLKVLSYIVKMDEMELLKEERNAEEDQVQEIEEWSDQGSDGEENPSPTVKKKNKKKLDTSRKLNLLCFSTV